MCDMKPTEKKLKQIWYIKIFFVSLYWKHKGYQNSVIRKKNNTMKEKKYTLDDVDGNAYAIMAYVCKSMRREGRTNEEIGNYLKDAQSGDYHHLLEVSVEMCEKLNEEDGNTRLILVDWDDDGENLPTEVKIPTDIADEDVADYLSDTYGFCVNGWYDINEQS